MLSGSVKVVCGKEASTIGEIIGTSANQIVQLKFLGGTKMYYIHQTPLPLAVLKGGLGMRLCFAQMTMKHSVCESF